MTYPPRAACLNLSLASYSDYASFALGLSFPLFDWVPVLIMRALRSRPGLPLFGSSFGWALSARPPDYAGLVGFVWWGFPLFTNWFLTIMRAVSFVPALLCSVRWTLIKLMFSSVFSPPSLRRAALAAHLCLFIFSLPFNKFGTLC